MSAIQPESVPPASNDNPAENVDKIREILFGGHMRDYERRFVQLEQRLLDESRRLNESMTAAIQELRALLARESEARDSSIHAERTLREQERRTSIAQLDQLDGALRNQVGEARELAQRELAAARDSLAQQADARHAELSSALGRVGDDLGRDKAGRSELAKLFAELAQRLGA